MHISKQDNISPKAFPRHPYYSQGFGMDFE